MLPGTYGCFQISNAWMANIGARPQKKRAIALAMNNSFGNTALVWTPYLYPKEDGPRYIKAWSVNLALCVVVFVATFVLGFCLKRDNKKMDETYAQGFSEEENVGTKTGVQIGHENAAVQRKLGNGRYDT
jgi:hypothetical protein